MKLTPSRADDALRRLDPEVRAVLFYGPDLGMVRERAIALVRTVVGVEDDPFRVTELNPLSLRGATMRLRDEAAAVAFGGGRRVVRVRDPRDDSLAAFDALLEGDPVEAVVVVEAGDLPKRSSVRKRFESAANALAVACYPDEGASLDNVISAALKEDKIAISAEARAYLHSQLGPDRLLARSELAKLAAHAGVGGTIDLDDVQSVVGDSAETSIDEVIYAAFSGRQTELDRALARSYADGVQPVTILRAAARHVDRLLEVAARADQGQALDDLVSALRPPIFFKRVAAFKSQSRVWRSQDLKSAHQRILEAEIQSKSGTLPGEAICNRALMELAQGARRSAQRN